MCTYLFLLCSPCGGAYPFTNHLKVRCASRIDALAFATLAHRMRPKRFANHVGGSLIAPPLAHALFVYEAGHWCGSKIGVALNDAGTS